MGPLSQPKATSTRQERVQTVTHGRRFSVYYESNFTEAVVRDRGMRARPILTSEGTVEIAVRCGALTATAAGVSAPGSSASFPSGVTITNTLAVR